MKKDVSWCRIEGGLNAVQFRLLITSHNAKSGTLHSDCSHQIEFSSGGIHDMRCKEVKNLAKETFKILPV